MEKNLIKGKNIALGVSGGIAAYKAVELCRALVDAGAYVTPILTESALQFVGLATFRALGTHEPLTDLWTSGDPIPHTKVGQNSDLIVVAPATANLIGKFAGAIADDALTTTLIASAAPIVLCGAMHTEMWFHPGVIENVQKIRDRGFCVVDPEAGRLAGGDVGFGRLAPTHKIMEAIQTELERRDEEEAGDSQPLKGRRLLISLGGTREAIDPVRFIGNRSSGKQGIAIVTEAALLGAVGVVVSTVDFARVDGFETIRVESALEMHQEILSHLSESDGLIMCAAVADYRVKNPASIKIKKGASAPQIELIENPDILADSSSYIKSNDLKCVTVGFAAETNDALLNGKKKLSKKGIDLMVVNDVTEDGSGFGSDSNAVWILDSQGSSERIDLAKKSKIAKSLLLSLVKILDLKFPLKN
ncbi:bifunctional phosphopantothenoylcysteine decarboxylase/phosphopantothenate--cysteine ligase CoaBC [Acidithrix sp. C25]|uniref:bifunctional phosphopantothenoylcysteine decarboxylase/phosphopantothenate--cysteine ligase CoaBC n=1 Tax=Acidithrix sp. C25 TaxID=1671482 RepID=UPI00191BA243|nr:bifunctional phosphopantothenoylcysteine decarboxylase/phosphopantothenate--cysteine ligase CoaBC [Acidithrix sp. C25]